MSLIWPNDETKRFLEHQPQKPKPESYVKHWVVVGFLAVMLAWMWFIVLTDGVR